MNSYIVYFLLLGGFIMYFLYSSFKNTKIFTSKVNNCTEIVDGKIVRFENTQKRRDNKIIYTFYPVMSYSFNGVDYEICSDVGIESLGAVEGYNVNDIIKLHVNPNNPSDFIYDISKYRNNAFGSIGFLFLTSCFMFISLLRMI